MVLHPKNELCSVDGIPIVEPTKLPQGAYPYPIHSSYIYYNFKFLWRNQSGGWEKNMKMSKEKGKSKVERLVSNRIIHPPCRLLNLEHIITLLEKYKLWISFNLFIFLTGCMLCIGHNNYFRFNHPQEAALIKEQFKGSRFSIVPDGVYPGKITFRQDQNTDIRFYYIIRFYHLAICNYHIYIYFYMNMALFTSIRIFQIPDY